jgi:hypothetical protein
MNPQVSAYEGLIGRFDFTKTPLGPPGASIIILDRPVYFFSIFASSYLGMTHKSRQNKSKKRKIDLSNLFRNQLRNSWLKQRQNPTRLGPMFLGDETLLCSPTNPTEVPESETHSLEIPDMCFSFPKESIIFKPSGNYCKYIPFFPILMRTIPF